MIQSKAKDVCHRLQIHLQRNKFAICHRIIDQLEEEFNSDDGIITTLAEIDQLDPVIINILDNAGYIYITDILNATDEDLLRLESIGKRRVDHIKEVIKRILRENARKKKRWIQKTC